MFWELGAEQRLVSASLRQASRHIDALEPYAAAFVTSVSHSNFLILRSFKPLQATSMLAAASSRALMHLRTVNPHVAGLLSARAQVCRWPFAKIALSTSGLLEVHLRWKCRSLSSSRMSCWCCHCDILRSALPLQQTSGESYLTTRYAHCRRKSSRCTWRGRTAQARCPRQRPAAAPRHTRAPAPLPSRHAAACCPMPAACQITPCGP